MLEVAPLPDQQRGWMNPDLKVYQTLVKIDGSHDFLKSRMSCKVQILVRQLEDVLVVPIQVVSNRRGKKVCYVMTPQGPQERAVQTGAFNDTFVQIIEDKGLQEGIGRDSQDNKVEIKIKRCYDQAERDDKVELFTSEPSLIDGRLEIANAVTDLIT